MNSLLILLIFAVVVGGYLWTVYNRFVSTKARIKASIQEIANQLKRQANLIPNLITSVKGYMKHESKIFKALTEARKMVTKLNAASSPKTLIEASSQLQSALQPIRVVLESTPELKAAGPTSKLMDELRDTADKVMYSRRTLIDLTADYNIMRQTFPSNLVANLFSFKAQPGLSSQSAEAEKEMTEVSKGEVKTPKVDL